MARYGGGVRDQAEQPPDEAPARPTDHLITLTERGPFLAPECTCGWRGPARRSRPLARDEAAAHAASAFGES
jgi:hypothetical protein